MPARPISLESIQAALRRIRPDVGATPVLRSSTLDERFSRRFFFKCENLQKTGSFKVRGAMNAVRCLTAEQAARGVCTHSSGNHGQAVAFAAAARGIACTVVVPDNTPQPKVDAIRGYGARVQLCEYARRQATCDEIAAQSGAHVIHPYDDADVMSGQGTLALELLASVPELDAIIVPVSGGGLVGGIAEAAKAIKPSIRVYGVEPKGKGLGECLAKGTRRLTESLAPLDTIADAIRTKSVGERPWVVLRELLEPTVFEVDDAQIREALRFSMQRMKLVVEPAGACALAAVLSGQLRGEVPEGASVGLVVCRGNADLKNLASLL